MEIVAPPPLDLSVPLPPPDLDVDMNPAGAAAGSIGIPPLNLSQGPAMAMGQSDGTQNGTNDVASGTGDFVFKGSGRAGPGLSLSSIAPVLAIIAGGGVVWLIVNRLS